MKTGPKIIVLKLGGECNLHCKHCHASRATYTLNEDIFPYLRKQTNLERITFSGGEPLMYFNLIKRVVSELPDTMTYKMPTNGTLLTSEMVDFFNDHNFKIFFSYDGENDSRDHSYIMCWNELTKLKNHGVSTVFSADTLDSKKLLNEVLRIREKYNLNYGNYISIWANFPHQTVNNNEVIGEDVIREYCKFIASQLEIDMRKFKAGHSEGTAVLSTAFDKWIRKHKWTRGLECCNDRVYSMTISGDFLLCPYDHTTLVGDIYSGIDWDKVESFIPEKCKTCPQWDSCGNSCVTNITENECYISKVMYKHFNKLMKKYGITYEELEEKCDQFYMNKHSKWELLKKKVSSVVGKLMGRGDHVD